MPVQLIAYLGYGALHGAETTPEAVFDRELRKYPVSAVIRLCSVLNGVISSWTRRDDAEIQRGLILSAFPPDVARRIFDTNRPVFHRHQLLFLTQEAVRRCGIDAPPVAGPNWGGLGTVFLMANDQLGRQFPALTEDVEKLVSLISAFIPAFEANSFQGFLHKMGRSYLMLSRFVDPLRGRKNFFDVTALFQEATGIPLSVYQALLTGVLARAAKIDVEKAVRDPDNFVVPMRWFSSTSVPQSQVDAFFTDMSTTTERLAGRILEESPRPDDFKILRDKPLLSEPEGFFPIDFSFLAEKFDTGPFWCVHHHLPGSKRENFHSFWGDVFEGYMNWVFGQSCGRKRNRFYPNPHYTEAPSEQVCDGLIICDRTVVLVEYKGATFSAASKYGRDIAALKYEMDQKLVVNKGVAQLVRAIERLFRLERPDQIDGVDLAGVTTVCPLVILRDDLGSVCGVNGYLNARFQSVKPRRLRCAVMPLFCLSAEDVEKLSSYLGDLPLASLLGAWKKRDHHLMGSFWMIDNKFIKERDPRPPMILKEATRQLTEMSTRTLGLDELLTGEAKT